eukprot:gene15650-17888_t
MKHTVSEVSHGAYDVCPTSIAISASFDLWKLSIGGQDGFPLTSLREVKTLKACSDHPNIVRLHEVVVGPNRDAVFLLFEYCEHDLATLMKSFKVPFKESEVKCLAMQLLSAVEHVHNNWIVHRDIKLSNLLYNAKGQLKLADFGLARTLSHPAPSNLTQTVVTLWYRAPELLLGSESYSFAIDIWSSGCILGELLLNQPLLPGKNELDQIKWIFHLLGCPNTRIWPGVEALPLVANGTIDLAREQKKYMYNTLQETFPKLRDEGIDMLHALLTYDPKLRPTAREALKHGYFHCSPYPQESDFMPTFPTQHDEMK